MKLEPMLQDASNLLIDDESADSTPIFQVCCKQWQLQLQLQLQYLARQSRATHKGARGSWGTRNKTFTRQNAIKKLEKINVVTFAAIV
jgi:hypothetical protein